MRDYLKLHFIVLIWGFTAIIGAFLTTESIVTVFYRTLIAAVAIWVWALTTNKSLRLDWRSVTNLAGIGVIIGLHWVTFFAAVQISGVSISLAGLSTTSLWTAVLLPFYSKRALSKIELFLGLLVIVGLLLVIKFEFDHGQGIFVALLSAMLASIFTILNGKLTHKYSHVTMTFYQMVGASLSCLALSPIFAQLFLHAKMPSFALNQSDLLLLLLLGVICTVFPFAGIIELNRRLSVFVTNLAVNMEPVYGMLLAALLLHEHKKLSGGFYLGALTIIAALILHPLLQFYAKRRPGLPHNSAKAPLSLVKKPPKV